MSVFNFRDFTVRQTNSGLKVGTDAMVFGAMIDSEGKKSGLDVGTGTGVLALMVAQKNPFVRVFAIENDSGAFTDAEFNFKNSKFSERLTAVHDDFLTYESHETFDLIFSNPPFYEDAKLGVSSQLNKAKHVSDLTPEVLFSRVKLYLSEGGQFWLIWPFQSYEEVLKVSAAQGFILQERIIVNGKPQSPTRVVLKFGLQSEILQESTFTIRANSGEYTSQYKSLTQDFHDRPL